MTQQAIIKMQSDHFTSVSAVFHLLYSVKNEEQYESNTEMQSSHSASVSAVFNSLYIVTNEKH